MSRWSQYDNDDERLPEGMTRVGYDADEQVYTFRDADGSIWESAPGNRFGQLTKVSGPPSDDDQAPFLPIEETTPYETPTSWRHDMMPLLNFGVIVGVCLLLLFWFMSSGTSPAVEPVSCPDGLAPYTIQDGDTCWKIADEHGLTVDDVVTSNTGLDCDALQIASQICLPPPAKKDASD